MGTALPLAGLPRSQPTDGTVFDRPAPIPPCPLKCGIFISGPWDLQMQDEHGPFVRFIIENLQYVFLMTISMWGGTAGYLRLIKKNQQEFSVRAWIGECSISGFAGLMAIYFCQYAEYSTPITGLVTGFAGMMSGKLLVLAEDVCTDLFSRYFPRRNEDRPENKS
jgi:hypothetical protein